MNRVVYGLWVACGLFLTLTATAQHRQVSDATVLLPEAQLEVALPGNDYLFIGYTLLGTTGYTASGQHVRSDWQSGQLRLGYEHFWNDHWSGGATLRAVGRYHQGNAELLGLPGVVTPGLLLRHLSDLGPVRLGQRLGLEYAVTPPRYRFFSQEKNRALLRLRLDAEHTFALGSALALRPRLAYEAVVYLRLQREADQIKERVVDFGNLRAEVGVQVTPSFDVTPWVASQTQYISSLNFYDAQGNATGGGHVNLIKPAVGLDLRYTFLRSAAAERRPLPSQH